MKDLYQFRNYRKALVYLIESHPGGGHGQKSELAKALYSQPSHITAVLSDKAELSFEQAELVCKFFKLNSDESEYFMLLVHQNRAGTKSLAEFYNQLLERFENRMKDLKNTLKSTHTVSKEYEALYYSDWLCSAIHVLISIPEYQNRESLVKHLRLPAERIDTVLSFLEKAGLCEKVGHQFITTSKLLHLDKKSKFIKIHHTTLRLQTINYIQNLSEENYHYSGTISISKSDFNEVKKILNECLKKIIALVQESKEEQAATLCLDFFKI